MGKAIVLLADGFEECEALLVVDVLRRAGVDVVMAAVNATGDKTVPGSHGIRVQADVSAEDVDFSSAELLFLPGGLPGTNHLRESELVLQQCRSFAANPGKKLAAICAAPSILGGLGLLQGKKATSHPGFENQLTGATVLHEEFVVDGNIITGRGLGAALPFALKLAALMESDAVSEKIRAAICYEH